MSENNFIGYEYKTITVSQQMKSVYIDGLSNYGWILDSEPTSALTVGQITLRLKRDRKLINKVELIRLEQQFDSLVKEVVSLESKKTALASVVAYSIGVIGCVFMAGAVFAISAPVPNMLLSVVFGILGLITWILPYFCFSFIKRKKTLASNELIEKKYDEIYTSCENGNRLLGL